MASSKFQIKPFGTWQKTEVKNLQTALISEALQQAAGIPFGLGTTVDTDHNQTPVFFGGLYLNYKPTEKLNINFNPYYSSQQSQTTSYNSVIGFSPYTQAGKIDNKFIANASISYKASERITLSLTGRNFLANDSKEYFGGSRTGALYLIGIRGNF